MKLALVKAELATLEASIFTWKKCEVEVIRQQEIWECEERECLEKDVKEVLARNGPDCCQAHPLDRGGAGGASGEPAGQTG